MNITCPTCNEIKVVSDSLVLKQLDSKYPAQTVTVTCTKCGTQLIMQARDKKLGDSASSTGN